MSGTELHFLQMRNKTFCSALTHCMFQHMEREAHYHVWTMGLIILAPTSDFEFFSGHIRRKPILKGMFKNLHRGWA